MKRDGSTDRRRFLQQAAAGLTLGSLGLSCDSGRSGLGDGSLPSVAFSDASNVATGVGGSHPLAAKPSHFPPKAKQLVIVFLTGGFSHIDTFDPKPKLQADHGKLASTFRSGLPKLPLLGSQFSFKQHGESGIWMSDLFPHLGTVADELCVIRSMQTDDREHVQASLAMHTGSTTVPLPSIGSWLSYGLGTLNNELPSYMVVSQYFTFAGTQVLDSNFLPPVHQGVRIMPGNEPISDLKPAARTPSLHQLEQMMLREANEFHAAARPGDANLRAGMNSFDIAEGMMRVAPNLFSLSSESKATLDMYGISSGDNKSLGWQCLMVRRLVEQGVRVVEFIGGGTGINWDSHTDMEHHRPRAKEIDQPLTALIRDMKQRGLLDETLVAICTEFGRTPWSESAGSKGRNHYNRAFSCLLVGAGIKKGIVFGQTDDYGTDVIADPCHVHDYHATILHLMGIDHTRLTYRYAGRDFRLTDVHGNVMKQVLS